MIFVQLSQAFDYMKYLILFKKIQNFCITYNTFSYIYSFFNQRKVSTKINGS